MFILTGEMMKRREKHSSSQQRQQYKIQGVKVAELIVKCCVNIELHRYAFVYE